MLKRLSEAYGVSMPILVAMALVGLVVFSVVAGLATHAALAELWPAIPRPLAWTLALAAPPVYVLAVSIAGALLDKLRARRRS